MRQFNLEINGLEANALLSFMAIHMPELRAEPPLTKAVLDCLESVTSKLIAINEEMYG